MIQRLKAPWGDCKNYGKKQNKVRNAFLGEFADVGYSVAVRI